MAAVDDKTVTSPNARRGGAAIDRAHAELDAVGVKIRQYELIRELGRGGMGQVFLARDTRLARRVALKFLSRGLTERFVDEARTTARCTHENIVVIHEVDEHDGTPYMVLEYLEGSSLDTLIGAPLSAARTVELAVPVVRALVCAHEFGIVHRDLKPANIFLTAAGTIKVLDFGIAGPSQASEMMGTLPYMSPEQVRAELVDTRTDLWALGIVLHQLATGRHPVDPMTRPRMIAALTDDAPLALDPALPDVLRPIVARCVAKSRDERFATARELCGELEALLPARHGRRLADDESPYPGLASFQESDADRFFGRGHDVGRLVARLREQPLVGIVGPSGVGKSSLVRAGVAPALKASGDVWDVHVTRPGRAPLASLAALIGASEADLAAEPGRLGAVLRAGSRRQLVFVDQFEELYTLGASEAERRAFTACLRGAADDRDGPVRVAIAMRSDFLDRAGEDARFLDDLTRGLVFLQPLDHAGLRDALVRPLEPLGYAFEAGVVDAMVAALATTPGALPLLQFAASRLWESRDRARKSLTAAAHAEMGGIAGALATHADQVLGALPPASQLLARTVLVRLVTPERTRAIVDRVELRELGSADAIVDHLIGARLLVGDATTIELVHESLIDGWPALRRWLDEGQEHAAYLAQVRTAARQWDGKGRTPDLLWRGDAEREARQFRARYRGELGERERAFLTAVAALATRATRRRRGVVVAIIAALAATAIGSAIALVSIRDARDEAEAEAEHAQQAEAKDQQELEALKAEQAARARAEDQARDKGHEADMSRDQLEQALADARAEKELADRQKERADQEKEAADQARARAERAAEDAKDAKDKAEAANQQLEKMLDDARQRAAEAKIRDAQITNTLRK